MNITAAILVKNEAKNIEECLKGLQWCSEVMIINDESDDSTIEIAKKLGAAVYEHKLNGDFAAQRNRALEKAKNTWVLFVDADERVSPGLAGEIEQSLNRQDGSIYGYFIKRVDVMWGKELRHGETGNIKLLRLARKDAGLWKGKVHEEWKIVGRTSNLQEPLYHYPHQSVASFLKKINFYTDLRASELFSQKNKVHVWDIIIYTKAKFALNYIVKLGFLDGIPGLISAIMMSFHSFLVRGKLWTLWDRK